MKITYSRIEDTKPMSSVEAGELILLGGEPHIVLHLTKGKTSGVANLNDGSIVYVHFDQLVRPIPNAELFIS